MAKYIKTNEILASTLVTVAFSSVLWFVTIYCSKFRYIDKEKYTHLGNDYGFFDVEN
jgi:hypothetical protein